MKINTNQLLHLSYALLKTLSVAHSEEIYHTNLNPSNILLDENWVPKITGWGRTELELNSDEVYSAPELYLMGK
jgi:serine/threonine protein kinase